MKRVVQERMKLGLSQAALARKAGINQSSMCRIEHGQEPPYRLRSKRIADALDWDDEPMKLFEEVK